MYACWYGFILLVLKFYLLFYFIFYVALFSLLSMTPSQQIMFGSRPHLSVGYLNNKDQSHDPPVKKHWCKNRFVALYIGLYVKIFKFIRRCLCFCKDGSTGSTTSASLLRNVTNQDLHWEACDSCVSEWTVWPVIKDSLLPFHLRDFSVGWERLRILILAKNEFWSLKGGVFLKPFYLKYLKCARTVVDVCFYNLTTVPDMCERL